MRKRLIAVMLLASIMMVGCANDTIVIEENTQSQQSLEKYKITERVIENKYDNKLFQPIMYNDEGVYGTLSTITLNTEIPADETDVPYLINTNGEFEKIDESHSMSDELSVICNLRNYYGIVNEGIHSRDIRYYYRDIKNNVKIEIEDYNTMAVEAKAYEDGLIGRGFKINDDYYIDLSILINTKTAEVKYEKVIVVDIKNEKVYSIDDLDSWYFYFYYDEKENSIMAFNTLGAVKKVVIEDDKLTFEDYKTIDMKGTKFINSVLGSLSITAGDNLILGLYDEKDFGQMGVYNIYSNEINISDKFIKTDVQNSDLFITTENGYCYLSEVNEEGNIELIYKLFKDEGDSIIQAISNDEGNSIFIRKNNINYDDENATTFYKDLKYYFIEIEKR